MSSQFSSSLIRRNFNLNQSLLPLIPTLFLGANQLRMITRKKEQGDTEAVNKKLPGGSKLQQLLNSDSTSTGGGGWDKCWEERVTPWDLGQPTPVIAHLHRLGGALVPGCGTLFSSLPNAMHFTFLKVDFFSWHPTEMFDLIFDYTFFCAIERDMRSAWAQKMREILKPDGELITLIFPIGDYVGGPPYRVSVSDYEEVLHPVGFKAISVVDNDLAVLLRKADKS